MADDEQVSGALEDLGDALRRQPSVRGEVMRRVTEHAATGGGTIGARARRGRRTLARFAALAACLLVAAIIWSLWDRGPGAQEAFAAAIANVERAGTFACRQIVTQVNDEGKEEVSETRFMFKEPDLERIEYVTGMSSDGEVMITDYKTRMRLQLFPKDKTATLQDIRSLYTVDDKTGELKLTELGTHARDDVLRISATAVQDLGMSKLNGRDVWVLRSAGGKGPIKTVYVNPDDGKPVQIELAWPTGTFTYADIHIDVDLDESLFRLETPQGYALRKEAEPTPSKTRSMKMAAKMMHLVRACYEYREKHEDQWPKELSDLVKGGMDPKVLKNMLASPDEPDGPSVVVYRKPRDGDKEAIVVYEAKEHRRDGKVVAGFVDGHAQIMTEEEFKDQLE